MSNVSDPQPKKGEREEESEHKNLKVSYTPSQKHKFEGWPILWILLIIIIIFFILWYTGTITTILKWVDGK